jgi:NADP-dependent 3-hydroxy acid dehydrogenase YdfG
LDTGLSNCAAIVGGASSGMGRAVAEALAAEGCQVALFARRAELLDEAVAAIEAAGGQALAVAGDSTRRADLERAVAQTVDRFGRLDVVGWSR